MSNSPINFGTGFLGSAVGSFSSKKNAGKIKSRVSKLENQVGAMISKQNQGPTQVEQPIEIQPEPQLGVVPQAFDGSTEEEPELLSNVPTIASPFSPKAQQAAGGMFGAPMPGSFDRNMGESPIMNTDPYSKPITKKPVGELPTRVKPENTGYQVPLPNPPQNKIKSKAKKEEVIFPKRIKNI